jgi:phosphoribosylformylglycinamidine cyclo-ligase
LSERYAQAGVDIAAGDRAVDLIKRVVSATQGPSVLGSVGAFAGLYALSGLREPVLVASTDGVGTKLKIAIELGAYDSIGRDLVNLSIDDVLTTGARPIFFLDYIATGKLVPERVAELVQGMAAACAEAGCALIGGETAEMRDVYRGNDLDLAGFVVGVVERNRVVDGSSVQVGDDIWALPSNGLHTNGYTLAREVLDGIGLSEIPAGLDKSLGDALLAAHPSYLGPMTPAIDAGLVRAMAHITGGGLPGNLARTIPASLGARVQWGRWKVLPIFDLICERGGVPMREMMSVFNMGVGFTFVSDPVARAQVLSLVPDALLIGSIERNDSETRVIIEGLS